MEKRIYKAERESWGGKEVLGMRRGRWIVGHVSAHW